MVNLIIHEPDIDKIDLYAKDPYEVKYQFKWFKIFYWIHKWYGWYLQKYWRKQLKKETKNIDCIWWYGCWHA